MKICIFVGTLANIKQDKEVVKMSGKKYDSHNVEILLTKNITFTSNIQKSMKVLKLSSWFLVWSWCIMFAIVFQKHSWKNIGMLSFYVQKIKLKQAGKCHLKIFDKHFPLLYRKG